MVFFKWFSIFIFNILKFLKNDILYYKKIYQNLIIKILLSFYLFPFERVMKIINTVNHTTTKQQLIYFFSKT